MKEIPFKDVYIHGTVRDIEGKKMSKSLGNIIDPLEIINEYGTDALRFSLISITTQGQDVFLSKERFEQGRNFANKIWNASRFILMNLDASAAKKGLCEFSEKNDLSLVNRWILSRFYSTAEEVNKYLETYKFNEAANALYAFFWHEFCDWYLEIIKPDIKQDQNQAVMFGVLENFLKIAHPFMPFVTEEIWQALKESKEQRAEGRGQRTEGKESIMIQSWPHLQEQMIDNKIENKMAVVFEIITTIRNMRSDLEISPYDTINAKICLENKATRQLLESMTSQMKNLTRLGNLAIEKEYSHAKGEWTVVLKDMHIVIPLAGVVDIEKSLQKTEQKIKKAEAEIKTKQSRLTNRAFVERAPAEVVEKEKDRLKELTDTLNKLILLRNKLKND